MVGGSLSNGLEATMVLLHKKVSVEILYLQERGGGPLVSVSYTHLDVYKRQM